ncbi:MAG: hypothetical protein U0586_17415 [Candidatus Brocadiaceae bacterium]
MTEKIAAFDSAIFKKEYSGGSSFKMAIGGGIAVANQNSFVKAYDQELTSIFEQNRIERTRQAYCASELSAILSAGIQNEESILATLFSKLASYIQEAHFYYTFLPNMEYVSAFGEDPGRYEKIPVISNTERDFFDLIEPSYSMLCAWKYAKNNKTDKLLIDNFQGQISPAWEELWGIRNVYAYFSGDMCNPLISASDLLVRLLKFRLLKNRKRYSEEVMTSLIPELTLKPEFIGKRDLRYITPYKRRRINNAQLLKHPIYFIFRENSKDDDEIEIIKRSPNYSKLLNYAYDTDASVKFFHPDDTSMIRPGDGILSLGQRGEKYLQEFKKLGLNVDRLNDKI